MERNKIRIDRELLEQARQRAREEKRDESNMIEATLKRYLDGEDR